MPRNTVPTLVATALAALLGCDDEKPSFDAPENTVPLCSDGVDNDIDGQTDCADTDCMAFDICSADGGDGGSDGDTDTDSDPPETWTLMMYEDADNNLEKVLLDDINEAERADFPDNANVIVLVDRTEGYTNQDGDWTGAKLFRLEHDEDMVAIGSPRLADPDFLGLTDDSPNGEEIDMGSGETLEKFIDFCQSAFPADAYVLHISDHGSGWEKKHESGELPMKAMCSDDSSGHMISMSSDFPNAVEGKGIAAVSLDACLLGTVEVAWAVREHIDYFSASVKSVPGTGFEYESTLNTWFGDMTAEGWVRATVDAYEAYYGGQSGVGFSAVDLTGMEAFGEALAPFLEEVEGVSTEALKAAKDAAATPEWFGWNSMVDFRDFVLKCQDAVGGDTPGALVEAFDDIVVAYWYSDDLSDLGALSVYGPIPEMFGGWIGGYDEAYDYTPFAQETDWDDLARRLTEE